eukprot:scaffold12646_cov115-Isochrysis_galbana.AAC.8
MAINMLQKGCWGGNGREGRPGCTCGEASNEAASMTSSRSSSLMLSKRPSVASTSTSPSRTGTRTMEASCGVSKRGSGASPESGARPSWNGVLNARSCSRGEGETGGRGGWWWEKKRRVGRGTSSWASIMRASFPTSPHLFHSLPVPSAPLATGPNGRSDHATQQTPCCAEAGMPRGNRNAPQKPPGRRSTSPCRRAHLLWRPEGYMHLALSRPRLERAQRRRGVCPHPSKQ